MLYVFECEAPNGRTTAQIVAKTEDDARFLLSLAKAFKGCTIGALIRTVAI